MKPIEHYHNATYAIEPKPEPSFSKRMQDLEQAQRRCLDPGPLPPLWSARFWPAAIDQPPPPNFILELPPAAEEEWQAGVEIKGRYGSTLHRELWPEQPNYGHRTVHPPEQRRWAAEQPTRYTSLAVRTAMDIWAVEDGEARGYFPDDPEDRRRSRLGDDVSPRWELIEDAAFCRSKYKKRDLSPQRWQFGFVWSEEDREWQDRRTWRPPEEFPALARPKDKPPTRPYAAPFASKRAARAFLEEQPGHAITVCPPFTTTAMLNKKNVGRPKNKLGLTAKELAKERKRKQRAKERDELQNPVGQRRKRKPEQEATYHARQKIFETATTKGQRNGKPRSTINPANRSRAGDGRAKRDGEK